MRISELAERTGVPVHTLKYYLREGILMPGTPQTSTSSDYDESHVARIRLIRALIERGGIGVAGVRDILDAMEAPPESPHAFLGRTFYAIPVAGSEVEPSEEVRQIMDDLGWTIAPHSPFLGALTSAIASARSAGLGMDPESVKAYAAPMTAIAAIDMGYIGRTDTVEDLVRMAVLGSVLIDPVIIALRRLAGEAFSAQLGYDRQTGGRRPPATPSDEPDEDAGEPTG